MLTKEKIVKILRKDYPYLANEYGVSKIGLFGSYAKGKEKKTSDIDLVVEFDYPIGLRFMELAEHLENLLGQKVDMLTPAGIHGIRIAQISEDIVKNIVYVSAD